MDLLEEQSRFFANQNQPSATVARRNATGDNTTANSGRPISKFAAARQKQTPTTESQDNSFPEPMSVVSLKIIEKDTNLVPVTAPEFRTTPFPELVRHNSGENRKPQINVIKGAGESAQSEFGSRDDSCRQSSSDPKQSTLSPVTSNAYLPDKKEIHEENEKLLRSMSNAQKQEMLRELQAMDPKLFEQMRNRSKTLKSTQSPATDAATSAQSLDENLPIPEFIDEQLRDGRLCNLPEPTEEDRRKMQWMLDVSASKDEGNEPLSPSDLRFDFDGRLVEPGRTIDVTEGLHHHGEAPHAAGYTVPELARLCRSAYSGQRILAMQVRFKIFWCFQAPAAPYHLARDLAYHPVGHFGIEP
jgi:hypothetical protein